MKKEQTTAAAVAPDTAAAAAVETVPAPTASIQATEETDQEPDEYSEELAKAKTVIVVGIYPGAADIVEKIYKNVPEDVTVVFTESSDTNLGSFLQLVTEALADPAIPEEFIAVPCGCVPCGGVDLDAMRLTTVYVNKNGKKKYDSGLPMVIRKSSAIEVLEKLEVLYDDSTRPDVLSEAFAEMYVKEHRPRPTVVSFLHGNYVTPVNRANPCEHVVIEALVQKKFITSNPEGFKAIIPVLEQTFNK